ncbi:MAG TPA: pyrroline-5-carboxylate reductase [Micropepsaceae bacterium]|nr:pyrroline-5-carboxylate reductase [Micropepsaceae bacterium]
MSRARKQQARPALLFIGAGRMGGAFLRGLVARDEFSLLVIEPRASPALKALARAGQIILNPDLAAMGLARLAVIAVKPQVLPEAIAPLRPLLSHMAVLSIAAGVRVKRLEDLCGTRRIIRAMPNLAVEIGMGISAAYAARGATRADVVLALSILRAGGKAEIVAREDLLDAVTAVSGSGPAYTFHLVEALAEAAQKEGLPPALARLLANETLAGAAGLLARSGDPAHLREQVTSPGGTTEAGLRVLMGRGGLTPLVRKTVAAARKRARDLGR